MDLAHQFIAHKLNRRAVAERENERLDEMERKTAPLFYAVMFITAGAVFGIPLFYAGQQSAMKECPKANQGEKLIYSEQRKDGTICQYSTGWNLNGRNRVTRGVK